MYPTCSEFAIFMYWTCNPMNDILSYCGLVDARIRASDKDLPVFMTLPKSSYAFTNWINEKAWFLYCSIIHFSRHRFLPWFYVIICQFVVVDIRKFKACQVFLRLMTEWLTFNGRIHIPNGIADLLFISIFFPWRVIHK